MATPGGLNLVGDGNRREGVGWTIDYENGRFGYTFSAPSYFDKCDLVLNNRNDVASALRQDIEFEARQHGLDLPDYRISQEVQRAYAQLYSQCLISDAQGIGGAVNPSSQNTAPSQIPGAADPSMRYLRRVDPGSNTSVFDTGAPPVPLRPRTQSPLAPAPPAYGGVGRSGDRTDLGTGDPRFAQSGVGSSNSLQPTPPLQSGGAAALAAAYYNSDPSSFRGLGSPMPDSVPFANPPGSLATPSVEAIAVTPWYSPAQSQVDAMLATARNRGPGNWTMPLPYRQPTPPSTAPADSFDNSSSPVLRYLEEYRRSAAPQPGQPYPVDNYGAPSERPGYAPGGASFSPDDQGSFGNPTSSQAFPPQADPDFRELHSPNLPLGWSRSSEFAPNQTQRQPGQLIGIFDGEPFDPLPPSVFGLSDRSSPSDNDINDLFARWIKSYGQ
jgi:hypothetical protein